MTNQRIVAAADVNMARNTTSDNVADSRWDAQRTISTDSSDN
jgi:hypothetical protein